jgi:hypothetical protein
MLICVLVWYSIETIWVAFISNVFMCWVGWIRWLAESTWSTSRGKKHSPPEHFSRLLRPYYRLSEHEYKASSFAKRQTHFAVQFTPAIHYNMWDLRRQLRSWISYRLSAPMFIQIRRIISRLSMHDSWRTWRISHWCMPIVRKLHFLLNITLISAIDNSLVSTPTYLL